MKHSVCFIGHRKIEDTPELRKRLQSVLAQLITNGTINFIFGDHSAFNDLCYELVTEQKEMHSAIRRIYFRKDYESADDYTMRFLLSGYEESVCPKGIGSAGRAGYIERNRAMIEASETCVFYYDETYRPARRKNSRHGLSDHQPESGTALAFHYAEKKKKPIINCYKTPAP